MASVRSLGLHEPVAIPYLVAESKLPANPSDDQFVWKICAVDNGTGSLLEEEIIFTNNYVVWSRGGVVKRSFSFDIEKEEIIDALFATFPASSIEGESTRTFGKSPTAENPSRNGIAAANDDLQNNLTGRKRLQEGGKVASQSGAIPTLAVGDGYVESNLRRALVVVLKSQAHVFFVNGDSHVVPLPFEVDAVWATPRGLLLQRKVTGEWKKTVPAAPPNSFVSSQTKYQNSFTLSGGSGARPSLTLSPAQPLKWIPKMYDNTFLPRVFCLVDPHSEMGLVVASNPSLSTQDNGASFDALDPMEEVLYVSAKDEAANGNAKGPDKYPLLFVVTLNEKSGMYTIWTARYRDKDSALSNSKKRMSTVGGTHSKRRSSHFDMVGVNTPVGRGPAGLRESFGGLNHGRSVSDLSKPNQKPNTDDEEDFASQLGHEFDDIGVSMRASRRVSSLLSRADLAANNDRTTFSDLVTGTQNASSFYGGRRGESFGGQTGRSSFGYHHRNSLTQGSTSIYSNGSSFLDAPVDKFLESLNNGGDFEGFDSMGLRETISGLPRGLMLVKVDSFSSGLQTTRSTSTFPRDRKFEVFTISSYQDTSSESPDSLSIALCILNKNLKNLSVVSLLATNTSSEAQPKSRVRKEKKSHGLSDRGFTVRATGVLNGPNVVDCCKLVDEDVSRILILSSTIDGRGELTLQAPWSSLVKVELPSSMMIYGPHGMSITSSPNRPREGSLKRVLSDGSFDLCGLLHSTNRGKVDVVDKKGRKHRIQIQLEPHNPRVKQILDVCRFVLRRAHNAGDGILVGWWEVLKWLQARREGDNDNDLEWTAMVVVLFTMGVYFIEGNHSKPATRPKRRKAEFLRSSSGSSIDLDNWDSMLDQEAGSHGVGSSWMMGSAWGWVLEEDLKPTEEISWGDHRPGPEAGAIPRKNAYILRCAALSREFLSSPQGEAAIGAEGYLPTAVSRDPDTRRTTLGTILVGLHLFREEQKLSTINAETSYSKTGLLAPVLAQIGGWLGWESWDWKRNGYYSVEMASIDRWAFEESRISALDLPEEPFPPPSILSFVEKSLNHEQAKFLTILDVVSSSAQAAGRDSTLQQAMRLTPRTLALSGFISELKPQTTVEDRVELLLRWGLTSSVIDTLPDGISVPLHEAIVRCQPAPPSHWGSSLLALIDRDDLFMSMTEDRASSPMSRSPFIQSHDAARDVHSIGNPSLDGTTVNSFEVSAEADRQSITRLIFREDRRFYEAFRILNQMKPPYAEYVPAPGLSESEVLEAQKELVQLVVLRTLSVPAGRAMIGFSGRVPLLTEKLPIPAFSLQCVMKPSNVTISAEKSAFSEDKACWAFFHNGASTGLAISKAAKGIDTSWILYNKPIELTNRHAGFLLALGLNGHLKSLAKWVAFKYLTPKHTMTSIGLLLGLSASYLGTMDTLITRLLSVHVTRMLPPGAAELNLSPLTQTTGIMGIGLLYCNSQHRRMSEVMLSEMENTDQEEPSVSHDILRGEGYRLAAGFALGFINLAKGSDLRGLRDMHIVERLLTLAVGTKNVDVVHILDKATAGATVALAIIFMKSNDAAVAEKIDIPDTVAQFDYVRPDIFLLRTLAKHLIMWDSITASYRWIKNNIPSIYKRKYRLMTIHHLSTDDMPFFNIVAGLCFAIGLRFVGSGLPQARDLLVSYLDQFKRISRFAVHNYDEKLTRNAVRNCQDIIALSAAAVMAGTGDLIVFRRLRSLHGHVGGDIPYGSHMAAHMAIGMLFLGGGTYTLGTSNLGIAALLCSFYPVFPTTVLDNKCHLQAFRHLWVLAAEPRCLIPRDLDTRRAVTIPVSVTLKTGESQVTTAPCLLPDLDDLATVKIQSPDHWDLTLDFAGNPDLRDKFRLGNQSVYLRRRAVYNASCTSEFSSSLMALSDVQDIPSSSVPGYSRTVNAVPSAAASILYSQGKSSIQVRFPARHLWEWIFNLPAFRILDMGDKALVIPSLPSQQPITIYARDQSKIVIESPSWLRPSAVDTRLVLEKTVQHLVAAATGQGGGDDTVKDRLWQLRLLFAWLDSNDDLGRRKSATGEKGSFNTFKGMWLRTDIIEDARWRVWGVQVGDNDTSGQLVEVAEVRKM
ncbi:anaphase-promoting complex subunit 1 [Blastomyces dermatitidis ATCC 18188]|uniref:Anaphase-promoting complex subunit 1 n=1 Tax=Ajellomyces dermatitidis (strain ATCC 18188 / CBS 674.68) TaxID=653446 RepID=F2T6X4_AJEDA|nr:anaphase-promoting complex subunit 1 [Blastomyces dermatitidis ATCC 18188]